MINFDREFIFIHIPKNAGSSIEMALLDTYDNEHDLVNRAQKQAKEWPLWPMHFLHHGEQNRLFGAQLHDHSQHRMLRDFREEVRTYFSLCVVRNPWERMVSLYEYGKAHGDYSISFYDYVHQFPNIELVPPRHELMQHQYARGVTYIMRYENLQADFDTACELIGIRPRKLPRINVSKRPKVETYYTQEIAETVGGIFGLDAKLFGYKFND